MPYTHSIDGRVVHVRWFGALSQRDLDALGEEMPRIGRRLGFAPDVLHTFADVKAHGIQPCAAFTYSLRERQEPIPNPIRVAIVADTEEAHALASVFKELNRTPNMTMKVCPDEASARRWLGQK